MTINSPTCISEMAVDATKQACEPVRCHLQLMREN